MRSLHLLDMTFGGIEETIKSDVINIQQLRSQLELNNFKINAITDLDIMANSNDFDTIYVGNVFIKQGRNLFLVHDLRSDFRKLPIPVNIRFEDDDINLLPASDLLNILALGQVDEEIDKFILRDYLVDNLNRFYRELYSDLKFNKINSEEYVTKLEGYNVLVDKLHIHSGITLVELNINNKHIAHMKLIINNIGGPVLTVNLDKRIDSDVRTFILTTRELAHLYSIYKDKGTLQLNVSKNDVLWERTVSRVTAFNKDSDIHKSILDFLGIKNEGILVSHQKTAI